MEPRGQGQAIVADDFWKQLNATTTGRTTMSYPRAWDHYNASERKLTEDGAYNRLLLCQLSLASGAVRYQVRYAVVRR